MNYSRLKSFHIKEKILENSVEMSDMCKNVSCLKVYDVIAINKFPTENYWIMKMIEMCLNI